MKFQKGDPKVIKAWTFYDWANSVYPLVITSAIFPIFYEAVSSKKDAAGQMIPGSDMVQFFGYDFINTELYTYTISLSFLIVSLISPILSGIADASGNKKFFLKVFSWIGSMSCVSFFWFADLWHSGFYGVALLQIIGASVGFWGSLVFYNAYLPEIAEPKDHDAISAKGFIMGYLGSSTLLIICLIIIQVVFDASYTKYCFLLVGFWWIGFAQLTFKKLPGNVFKKRDNSIDFWKGFKEINGVFKSLKNYPNLKKFLFSFFIYSMGLQTVFVVATNFGKKELGLETANLIISILLIQFIGIIGAWLFSKWSAKFGNIKSLAVSLIIWTLICISAYAFLDASEPMESKAMKFYFAAAAVGLVMGGVQALSRSTYSKLLPDTEDHASFFSFYDVSEKIGIVIGTATWAYIEGLFEGSMKPGILSLGLFFIVGLVLLFRVPNKLFKKDNGK